MVRTEPLEGSIFKTASEGDISGAVEVVEVGDLQNYQAAFQDFKS